MCGIVGAINFDNSSVVHDLCNRMERRGRDSSGIVAISRASMVVKRADFRLGRLLDSMPSEKFSSFFAHSRLITNSINENQPVKTEKVYVFHNGIILNKPEIEGQTKTLTSQTIDSVAINLLVEDWLSESVTSNQDLDYEELEKSLARIEGTVSSLIYVPHLSLCLAYSNNGSLFTTELNEGHLFCSERHPLSKYSSEIFQIKGLLSFTVNGDGWKNLDDNEIELKGSNKRLLAPLVYKESKAKQLQYDNLANRLRRCSKCILPETMPFITFDGMGVCNYCNNYQKSEVKGSLVALNKLVDPYRRRNSPFGR